MILSDTTFMAVGYVGDFILPPYWESVFTCNRADRTKIIKSLKQFTGVCLLLHTNMYLDLCGWWETNADELALKDYESSSVRNVISPLISPSLF